MMKSIIKSLFLMIAILLMIVGCGTKTYSEEKIAEIVKDSLQEKYDKEFDVLSVTKKNAGQILPRHYYVAQCTDKEGIGPFHVGIETDGSIVRDNYEGYLYKKSIDEELLEILTQAESITFLNYESTFLWSRDKSGSFHKYVESGSVTLVAEISVDALEMQEATGVVFELLDDLQQKGYGTRLKFYWKDMTLFFIRDGADPEFTRQYVDERFNAELSSGDSNE